MKMHKTGLIGAIAAVAVAGGVMANPVTYNFTQISGDNTGLTGNEFSVTISHTAGGGFGTVDFLFEFNHTPPPELENARIGDVAFSVGANQFISEPSFDAFVLPANTAGQGLPGGGNHGLRVQQGALADAGGFYFSEGTGVANNGSWLVTFTLQQSFSNLMDAIQSGFNNFGDFQSGDFTIGLRGKGLDGGASAEFAMTGDPGDPSIIPLPAPIWMGLAGLAGIMVIRRRRA